MALHRGCLQTTLRLTLVLKPGLLNSRLSMLLFPKLPMRLILSMILPGHPNETPNSRPRARHVPSDGSGVMFVKVTGGFATVSRYEPPPTWRLTRQD